VTIHIGLIGAGNISGTHARACSGLPDVRVAAVYAPTREHAMRLAAETGASVCDTLEALLAHRPLDMVAIGSPSGCHAEHGIAAARAGLHVLVEKPIDIAVERADRLIAATADCGLTLGVIFQDRFKPGVRRLKTIVDEGRLGSPVLASARVKWYRPAAYYSGSAWRGTRALDGGGALINQAVHTVDLLLWLCGPVRHVYGKAATRLHTIEVEDTAVGMLEFASGALGTIEATTAAYPGYARRLELTGSNGTAILDGDALVAVDLRERSGATGPHEDAPPHASPENVASPVVSDVGAHRAVFDDFIRAMRTGGRPCCDGAEGRRSVEVIEAIYRASTTGAPVTLKGAARG
jgi:UDP-N-acetyl-2-amino-2-deoxyglucuronate dehydrogenase